MKTTIYKCDRCGAEDTSNEIKIERVGAFVGSYQTYKSYGKNNREQVLEKEWCQTCRTDVGFQLHYDPKPQTESPITLEDLIRELIREEIGR